MVTVSQFNLFKPMVHFHFKGCLVVFFHFYSNLDRTLYYYLANSGELDETPRSAASDLAMHRLSMFH